MTMPRFLADLPRFVFFTGKGGVGKTSLACATAVRLADAGKRVLLLSTDPASNVGQVFGLTVGDRITPVPQVPGLDVLEIDPNQAAEAYREKIIAPVRDLLPQAELDSITEQLSGSCTTEIASFNEFTSFLADEERIAEYDNVVFDTAPTGHTIRLLQLPGEWTSFLDAGKGDASCLGPMAGLDRTRTVYAEAVRRLADPAQTRLVLVARAQQSTLREAARTSAELAAIGITGQHLVINAVLPKAVSDGESDALAEAVRGREHNAISEMPPVLRQLPLTTVPLHAQTVVGVDTVRALLHTGDTEIATFMENAQHPDLGSLDRLVDELATADHGLIMCMGKGGVGKTTVAASIAIALADRGHTAHLTTTDPAAHLDEVLDHQSIGNLTVSRIDPRVATQEYRDKVMASKGNKLDDAGRARLAEDLLSPCTEEVAVFGQFSHLVNQARRHFVVMDTAPTGHTLLLMDATGSYHRDIARSMGETGTYTTPLMRLRDPDLTKVVIVTLPDTTPVLEAAELQHDLERADIHPWAWVVNASLAAARPSSSLLRARAAAEQPQLERVTALAGRTAIIPMLADEPHGPDALRRLTTSTHQPA
ncbi:arsenite efflux ATP-binding protein ArsA [Yimella lutea]|uniref:Arsenite efflux ATP-binding protein ArsA n=1 Tax=Yimella lutea TaxID=587872 RepID=A0A542EBH9_9MICO|nr:arsenical pump-driving ATPase [Yimella lutea]TQJ12661.1 arsenite efflux ATP-binding protein ArsA [Yimella lutea]